MTQEMARRWWEGDRCSYRPLSGVFEGGGAKGVAYSGALRAVHEANCWFTAVAGASAGAITAAMVASGLGPKEIADLTPIALGKLSLRPVFRGLRQLKRTGGYVDARELREWLTQLMERQYQVLTGTPWGSSRWALMARLDGTDTVTFIGLHEASGIELNVVAADRRPSLERIRPQ